MLNKYAIFFPQFHQVHVNDHAWGYGFNDWALVSSANAFDMWNRRAPAVGYYDLKEYEHVCQQFECAKSYGLNGFGIYHYWFDSGRELSAVEDYLINCEVPTDFGFFFIWANEDWSKRWSGKNTEVLHEINKTPDIESVREHVKYLVQFIKMPAYTRVNDKPIFMFYRGEIFNDLKSVVNLYKRCFNELGVDIEIGLMVKRLSDFDDLEWFDFAYVFEPRFYQNFYGVRGNSFVSSIVRFFQRNLPTGFSEYIFSWVGKILNRKSHDSSFAKYKKYFFSPERRRIIESTAKPVQNIISCGWDNTPRYRDNATRLVDVPTEEEFKDFINIYSIEYKISEYPLMCNAWNEWSEGAALEPCYYLGDYLIRSYID